MSKNESTEDKMLRYEAFVIAEREGLVYEVALEKACAASELRNAPKTAKKSKYFKTRTRKGPRSRKRGGKTVYTVGGQVVTKIVSGGAPGLGRRK